MKKIGFLAAAAALLVATPVAAEGYLGARYSTGELESGGTDADFDNWQGEGAFGWNSGAWGGQFGGAFGNFEPDGGADTDYFRFDGHLYWNAGSGWRVGGVVAHTNIDDADVEEWSYGVESAFDLGANSRIWGSLTAADVETGGSELDGWNADVGLDFYANSNFRIGGNIGAGNLEDVTDADTFSAGINAEIQPWSAPVSIYGGWQMFNIDAGGADLESNAFTIGARWNFGGGTVQDRDNAMPFRQNTPFFGRLLDIGPR